MLPAVYINLFFAIGILSGLAIRSLIVFNHLNKDLIRPAWYFGVAGYMIFFAYRYVISQKRKRLIADAQLIEKLNTGQPLAEADREAVEYILLSISKSRENINYLFIFAMSLLAVLADVVLTFSDL
jgi:hypothetical protein